MNNLWSRLGGVLGIAYCVAGFFLIFLGWNGAATYDSVPAQLPYVVSGGFGGLGLIVLGSALIIAQSRRGERLVAAATANAAPRPATLPSAGGSVVAGPTSYHRPDCRVVEGLSDVVTMSAAEAASSGRTPCRVCQPGPVAAATA